MLLRVLAAIVVATALAKCSVGVVASDELEQKWAAATLLDAGRMFVAGGNASKACRYYKLNRKDCGQLVEHVDTAVTAIAGHCALVSVVDETGRHPCHVGRRLLDPAAAALSKAVRLLSAKISDGPATILLKKFEAALRDVERWRPRRLFKRLIQPLGRGTLPGAELSHRRSSVNDHESAGVRSRRPWMPWFGRHSRQSAPGNVRELPVLVEPPDVEAGLPATGSRGDSVYDQAQIGSQTSRAGWLSRESQSVVGENAPELQVLVEQPDVEAGLPAAVSWSRRAEGHSRNSQVGPRENAREMQVVVEQPDDSWTFPAAELRRRRHCENNVLVERPDQVSTLPARRRHQVAGAESWHAWAMRLLRELRAFAPANALRVTEKLQDPSADVFEDAALIGYVDREAFEKIVRLVEHPDAQCQLAIMDTEEAWDLFLGNPGHWGRFAARVRTSSENMWERFRTAIDTMAEALEQHCPAFMFSDPYLAGVLIVVGGLSDVLFLASIVQY